MTMNHRNLSEVSSKVYPSLERSPGKAIMTSMRIYPDPDEIVGLVREYGSYSAVDRALGWPVGTLHQWLGRASRRALKARCERERRTPAEQRRRLSPQSGNYPTDEEMVALMSEHQSFAAVARLLGVRRESLRDYLKRRPHLDAEMRKHLPVKLTESEKRERHRRTSREWARRHRAENPEKARADRSRWYRETPQGRRSGLLARERRRGVPLTEEAQEFLTILEGDPCVWCGERLPITPEHLQPVSLGGDGSADNLAGACRSCNSQRKNKSILQYLLYRKEVIHDQF